MEEKNKKDKEQEVDKEYVAGDLENPDSPVVEDTEKNHGKHKHRKDELAEKTKEIAELNDKYLRLYSEFDNYRKRTLREKIDLTKTASADVIVTLLPVLDDFERALKTLADSGETGAHEEGMILIYNKLKNILTQQGLEQIKAMGEDFNTDFHEAITNIPAPSPDQKGKVLDVIQQGYILGGKVIRFAKVVVGS